MLKAIWSSCLLLLKDPCWALSSCKKEPTGVQNRVQEPLLVSFCLGLIHSMLAAGTLQAPCILDIACIREEQHPTLRRKIRTFKVEGLVKDLGFKTQEPPSTNWNGETGIFLTGETQVKGHLGQGTRKPEPCGLHHHPTWPGWGPWEAILLLPCGLLRKQDSLKLNQNYESFFLSLIKINISSRTECLSSHTDSSICETGFILAVWIMFIFSSSHPLFFLSVHLAVYPNMAVAEMLEVKALMTQNQFRVDK